MYVKTIEYVDFNGTERKENFYFHLSQSELIEKELTTVGGLEQWYKKIITTQNLPEIAKLYKELILSSYGEKSADGRQFIKSPELSNAFAQTNAFDILYRDILSDTEKGAEFFNGILPKDLAEKAEELQKDPEAMAKILEP